MQRLADGNVVLPVQVLGELFRVLTRKYRLPAADVRDLVVRWTDVHPAAASSANALQSAMDLAADHGLAVWDCLVLAVAAEHRCRVLLSEDLQHGFTWSGVTVVNPFVEPEHPRLAALLG
jgi:predicted nucleic acid-binding protein